MNYDDLVKEYKVKFPTLRKMIETNYVNPKAEGKKIYVEKAGNMFVDGETKEGSYYVYKDSDMPSKYITVFVNSAVNEDGEATDNVHVLGFSKNKQQGINKIRYRLNVARKSS